MEPRLVSGTAVEHAGRSWRVERPLGADAVLLRGPDGQVLAADPAECRILAGVAPGAAAPAVVDERRIPEADWAEACRRRDLLLALAGQPGRTLAHADAVAAELGLKRRRTLALLRRLRTHGSEPAVFLPSRRAPRGKRLSREVEAVVARAIEQHYARPSRPSLLSLSREIDARCTAAGLAPPSYKAVQARVRERDQQWLVRRREGHRKGRSMRLLTGAHPGAAAPWARVQIDSTPCDIRLVREADRAVIGRPTVTFALDLYSRAVLGMSVCLDAASVATVATCLAHACLPKAEWLARRELSHLHWPAWGRPAVLEYDRGPENEAAGIQRGLRLHGITAKVRPVGRPELHGHVERLIGTLMRRIHERRGTTFGSVAERGEARPEETACLTLPELERVLALVVDSYNHTAHEATGERPIERYLAWYRQPGLADAERVPPRVPEERFLLDFLPHQTRVLTRGGFRLFRVDYSSRDLLPMWRRDNGRRVARIVVYDPRSLATVWVLDEETDDYIPVPYRTPHPDLTLAENEACRRRLRLLKAADRTERRLFDNLAEIRRTEAEAMTARARMRAERARQGRRAAGEGARPSGGSGAPGTGPDPASGAPPATGTPAGGAEGFEPFPEVEIL